VGHFANRADGTSETEIVIEPLGVPVVHLSQTQETTMLITMLIGVTVALAALTVAADPN
jgi:hypothetical protein